ncbi:tetratricopeptide repeat protein, partial [Citrobacter freundii]
PDSWNAYDSYGEALLKAGRKDDAIAMYRKSVALNPGNANAKAVLKRLAAGE